jgi:hypothetical protein
MELSDINSAHAKYPWASEATLEALVRVAGVNNSNLMRIAKRLNIDINSIDISDNKIAQEEYTSLTLNYASDLTSALTSEDPVDTAMQIFKKTAEFTVAGVQGGAGVIADMFNLWNKKIGKAISGLFSGIGDVFGVAKAVSIPVMQYFAQVIKLQQSESEAMIKYGVIVDNISMFTLFRKSAAGIGLSIEEMMKKIAPASIALANMNGGIMVAGGNLATIISTEQLGSAKKLGFSVADYTSTMIAQSETMYKLGKISTMDLPSLNRVHSRVSTTTILATQLAAHFGKSREAMLAEMKQSAETITWITARARALQTMADMGPDADKNIQDTMTLGIGALGDLLGEEQVEKLKKVFTMSVGNLKFDQDALSEFMVHAPELVNELKQIPGLFPAVLAFMNDGLSGQSSIKTINTFTEAMRNNQDIDENSQVFKTLAYQQQYVDYAYKSSQIMSKLIQSKKDGRLNPMSAWTKNDQEKLSSAAHIIGAFSELRIGMRQLHQAISPGFEDSKALMEMGQSWLNATEKQLYKMANIYSAFSEASGAPVPEAPTDDFTDLRDFYNKNMESDSPYDMTQYARPETHSYPGATYYKTKKGIELTEREMYDNLVAWLAYEAYKAKYGKGFERSNEFMKIAPDWLVSGMETLGIGADYKKVPMQTKIKPEHMDELFKLLRSRDIGRDAEMLMFKGYNLEEIQKGITDIEKAKMQSSIERINTDTLTVASILKNITRINSDLYDINGMI